MSSDIPNNNERQMREEVNRYKAEFEPKAWADMKTRLDKSPNAINGSETQEGGRKKRLLPLYFINLNTLLIMTITAIIISIIWIGLGADTTGDSSNIDHTNNSVGKEISITTDEAAAAKSQTAEITADAFSFDKKVNAIAGVRKQTQSKEFQDNVTPTKKSNTPYSETVKVGNAGILTADKKEDTKQEFTTKQNSTASSTTEPKLQSPPFLNLNKVPDFLPTLSGNISSAALEFDRNVTTPPKRRLIKKYTLGLYGGLSYTPFGNSKNSSLTTGLALQYRLGANFGLRGELGLRNVVVKDTKYSYNQAVFLPNGTLSGEYIHEQNLNELYLVEATAAVTYQLPFGDRAGSIIAGVRPTLSVIPFSDNRESVVAGSSSIDYTQPEYKAGINTFDMGGVFGYEFPIAKRIHLEARVNLHFKDITNDDFWAINPQRQTLTDYQIRIRWDIAKFNLPSVRR